MKRKVKNKKDLFILVQTQFHSKQHKDFKVYSLQIIFAYLKRFCQSFRL